MPRESSADLAKRHEIVNRVLADRPVVHYMSGQDFATNQLTGVWSTEDSCYHFMAERCGRGSRTLETGLGMSTVLFAAWGTEHICIAPGQVEVDALVTYCRTRGIAIDGVTFEVATSDIACTRLDPDAAELDLVLIDGCHGFPTPMIDWYFGAGRLRHGGVVIVDDLQLPAVRILTDFLDADPRWIKIGGTAKWAGFERQSHGPLLEDWYTQPFYAVAGRGEGRRTRAIVKRIIRTPSQLAPSWMRRR